MSGPEQDLAFAELVDETRLLFHRLRWAAREIHGGDDMTAGRRGVLNDLERHGPLTVPAIAALRPVSRQHIQTLVNSLAAEDLVELVANPHHKRSRLVQLTRAGRTSVAQMRRREQRATRAIGIEGTTAELRAAAATLRRLREQLTEAPWSRGDDNS